jgi:hypothetical protein
MGWLINLLVVMLCVTRELMLYPVQIVDSSMEEQEGITLWGFWVVHLLSFVIAFGTFLWTSFIDGIIIFK